MSVDALFVESTKQDSTLLAISGIKDDANLKMEISLRGGKRSSATKTLKYLSCNDLNATDVEHYLDKLEAIKTKLEEQDDKINSHMLFHSFWSNNDYIKQSEVCDKYQDEIGKQIKLLKAKLVQPIQSSLASNPPSYKLPFPQIELPSFDGSPEAYPRFIHSFETLISKYNLSAFEKYSYLLKQLKGPARLLVESVALSDLTYDSAKSLLDDAYCDKTSQQYSVVEKLKNLKLKSRPEDAFLWISEARIIEEQFKTLTITTEIILQYFLWNSLNDEFKSLIVAITNKSKPSVSEIFDNSFEANRRYQEIHKQKPLNTKIAGNLKLSSNLEAGKPNTNAVAMATNVAVRSDESKSTLSGCSLCSHDKKTSAKNHKLSNCPEYSNAESKLNKIKDVNGCAKCGLTNHVTKDCKYKFRFKCYCNKWHLTFLCPYWKKEAKETDPNLKSSHVKFSNNMVMFNEHTNINSDVILPTASVYIKSKNKKSHQLRLLKDTASQCSFIEESVANKFKCKTIGDSVDLVVTGFNSTEKYKSRLVEINLKTSNNDIKFEAVTVPHIKTCVNIPGLKKISSAFESKNYNLADKGLNSDKIHNISIILGADASYLFPLQHFEFGGDCGRPSVFYMTPDGVMLVGRASDVIANLECLPFFEKIPKNSD